jgi:hypothetical protein
MFTANGIVFGNIKTLLTVKWANVKYVAMHIG